MKRRRSNPLEIQARISEAKRMFAELAGDLPSDVVREAALGALDDVLGCETSRSSAETSTLRDLVDAARKARLQ